MTKHQILLALFLFSLVVGFTATLENKKQKELLGKMVTLSEQQQEQITKLTDSSLFLTSTLLEDQVIIKAIADDYPPKMKLTDRSWCKDRTCLNGTDDK